MLEKNQTPQNGASSRSKTHAGIRTLAVCALFCAMSIVLGKYLAIRGGDILRFSFENLPVLLAGMWFGPLAGVAVGVVSDLLGCLMVGYTINPLITLGAAAIGLVGGLLFRVIPEKKVFLSTLVPVFTAHLVGSVLIKTCGLAAFYSMPFFVLMLWRLMNYAIVAAAETGLIWLLRKNRGVRSLVGRIRGEKKSE